MSRETTARCVLCGATYLAADGKRGGCVECMTAVATILTRRRTYYAKGDRATLVIQQRGPEVAFGGDLVPQPPSCWGKCHGTVTWCSECNDVSEICDRPDDCDQHRRCDDCHLLERDCNCPAVAPKPFVLRLVR